MKSPPLVAYYWDGGAAVAHSIRDISLSGVYVVTDVRWYPGTHVMIALQRPDLAEGEPHRSLTVNAKVVRFGIDGLGFSFVMPAKRPSAYAGPYSREAENLSRNARGPGIPSGADKAALIGFLQETPKGSATIRRRKHQQCTGRCRYESSGSHRFAVRPDDPG